MNFAAAGSNPCLPFFSFARTFLYAPSLFFTFFIAMSSYTSSFPALHSLQLPINGKRGWSSLFPGSVAMVRPKIPSYLKHTLYADLVNDKYDSSKQADPLLDWHSLELQLPTSWNNKDKAKHINVDRLGLHLCYAGPGRTEAHAGAIRSNFAVPRSCGLFYYEIKVLSKGDDGYIGIGFCTRDNDLNRLPGWDQGSYGFHGDDGHAFAGSGTGRNFGPSFTTNDVIGCGIDFTNQTGFYTKNGTMIGVAFENISTSETFYPVVGLRTPGEAVLANFGDEPFLFDIDQFVKQKQADMMDQVNQTRACTSRDMMQLISAHLQRYGYNATYQALFRDYAYTSVAKQDQPSTAAIPQLPERDIRQMQGIRRAIMQGNIDEAITLTNQHYASVLQDPKGDMMFELRCAKFVEYVRQFNERHASPAPSMSPWSSQQPTRSPSASSMSASSSSSSSSGSGRRPSWAAIAAAATNAASSPSNSFGAAMSAASPLDIHHADNHQQHHALPPGMDQDPWLHTLTRTHSHGASSATSSVDLMSTSNDDQAPPDAVMTPPGAKDDTQLQDILTYGEALRNDYANDKRPHIQDRLKDVFSLFAYKNIQYNTCPPMVNLESRDELATNLITLILRKKCYLIRHVWATDARFFFSDELGQWDATQLEKLFKQYILVNKQLAFDGDGQAVILNKSGI
ncbi:hypothetical protein BC940DRAFT_350428 [Gongronella butleri]|nr:hypothetical protein BC940DRAFT_350428 [Gongronella butleri]